MSRSSGSSHTPWRYAVRTLCVVASLLFIPVVALAQATLTGTVKDTSGGVLPGVTVEATSPVLIEKVRTAVTDGGGQYRIIDLRPGLYTVKYVLNGFSVVERRDVEISGSGTIAIDAELKPGVQETVTVTGETPVVEVQSTRRQQVIDGETVNTIPVARGYGNLLTAVPGINTNSTASATGLAFSFFNSNGGPSNEGRVQIAGMNVGSAFGGGGVAAYSYDVVNVQEIQVTVSGGLGEADIGGPAMNIIPREGGNRFSGNAFLSEAGKWSQGDNRGDLATIITQPAGLVRNWDESFALGGPIVRDRLWFYGNLRDQGTMSRVTGNDMTSFPNLNAGNPALWTYAPDRTTSLRTAQSSRQAAIRLTGQITPRNKVTFYHDYNWDCWGSSLNSEGCRPRGDDWIALGSSNGAPETGTNWDDREKIIQGTWTSPMTNRLLLEAGYSTFISQWGGFPPAGNLLDLIPVQEQSTFYGVANYNYRGLTTYNHNQQQPQHWRASASYVTGAHNMKIGMQGALHMHKNFVDTVGSTQLSYRFNSLCQQTPGGPTMAPGAACNQQTGGIIVPTPNRVSLFLPSYTENRTTYEAFYVQDQWTMNRLTLNGALRYEWARSWHPEGTNGVVDNWISGPILDPRAEGVRGYHDIVPRVGAAYDVFGTGKTAVRFNVGKYLSTASNDGNFIINNVAGQRVRSVNRTWTDRNSNFVVDCDLRIATLSQTLDVPGGDLCGPGDNLNFGNIVRTGFVDPTLLEGWNQRGFDWVMSASVQQEILPRISIELAYNRRWWGNFTVADNLFLGPDSYDVVSLTAPLHPRLPDGGGYPISFRVPRVNAPTGTRSYTTLVGERECTTEFPCPNGATSGTFDTGERTAMYHSFQVQGRARTRWGLTLQGGTTTGRGVRDQCALEQNIPEINATGRVENCRIVEDFLTTFNGLVTYTVPKVDVLVSGILRSQPGTVPGATGSGGTSLSANYDVTNQQIFNQLGRNLVACPANSGPQGPGPACTNTQTVNLLLSGELYQDRVHSIDMRFAKLLRFGSKRLDVGVDLYNIINASAQTGYQADFGADGTGWLGFTGNGIQQARFARFNVTFTF